MKREANHACNEKLWAWKQKRYAMSVARMAVQERGQDMPTKPESLDKEKEEEGGNNSTSPISVAQDSSFVQRYHQSASGDPILRTPAEVDPDRDWAVGRLALATLYRVGIS
jgi:hypothetical protein